MGKKYFCIKLLLVFAVSFVMMSCQIATIFTQPHPATKVDPKKWVELRIGMTKDQVVSLLGDPPCQHKRRVENEEKNEIVSYEFWEYNFCSGALAGPDPKAYVIYFDVEGKVSYIREPTE